MIAEKAADMIRGRPPMEAAVMASGETVSNLIARDPATRDEIRRSQRLRGCRVNLQGEEGRFQPRRGGSFEEKHKETGRWLILADLRLRDGIEGVVNGLYDEGCRMTLEQELSFDPHDAGAEGVQQSVQPKPGKPSMRAGVRVSGERSRRPPDGPERRRTADRTLPSPCLPG